MRTIAHIINPVIVPETSDLYVAQPVTFETMRIAREFAQGQVDVQLFTAQYPEDHAIVPDDFHKTPDLDRSVLDLGEFTVPRKLPLLKDILDRLYTDSEAGYFVYTNVDIALLPHFYVTIDRLIEQGYDAFVINRRTIPDTYNRAEEISLMYAEVGEKHRGYDCFIFRRSAYDDFHLGLACLGINPIGRILLWNIAATANRFCEFKNLHLTFHIGNDSIWRNKRFADYREYNMNEARKILANLEDKYGNFEENEITRPYLRGFRSIENQNSSMMHKVKTLLGIG